MRCTQHISHGWTNFNAAGRAEAESTAPVTADVRRDLIGGPVSACQLQLDAQECSLRDAVPSSRSPDQDLGDCLNNVRIGNVNRTVGLGSIAGPSQARQIDARSDSNMIMWQKISARWARANDGLAARLHLLQAQHSKPLRTPSSQIVQNGHHDMVSLAIFPPYRRSKAVASCRLQHIADLST